MTTDITGGTPATPDRPLPDHGGQPEPIINALVRIALDDIEIGNLTVPGALRAVAEIAWSEGRASRTQTYTPRPRSPRR